jgi:chlorophyll/bacteriochlorophyll a synthase
MAPNNPALAARSLPNATAVLELLKPITWFAPMWAFGCGIVSSGVPILARWEMLVLGVLLAGPCVCATSQAANDWYDRFVDAINEPNRPIPSGRIPGNWGLIIALIWTTLSLAVASLLGPWVLGATVIGLLLAWGYSAPPFRFKMNGWYGNSAVAFAYEGLPWFTGAAVMLGTLPSWPVILAAALYSVGAHGIMTLNDFKAVEGDARMGIRSLPVQYGPAAAAKLACAVMALPQAGVVLMLMWLDRPWHALAVGVAFLAQTGLMVRLLGDPRARAPWYNATGVSLYVAGMLITAFAIRSL